MKTGNCDRAEHGGPVVPAMTTAAADVPSTVIDIIVVLCSKSAGLTEAAGTLSGDVIRKNSKKVDTYVPAPIGYNIEPRGE